MKKSFALVLALARSLTGASALAAKKVTVRFGNTAGEDDIQSISLRDVAGRLAEATGWPTLTRRCTSARLWAIRMI